MADPGKWAKLSVASLAVPSTSKASIDFLIDTDANSIVTRQSAGVYRVNEDGIYVVEGLGKLQDTSNGRSSPAWEITINGTVFAGSSGSGYTRDTANPYAWIRALGVIKLTTTDDITLNHWCDTDLPAGTYNAARLRLVKVAAPTAAYAHAGTPTAGAYGGTTPTRVTGWTAITETDATAIAIGSAGATLKNGRYYLFCASMMNSDGGGARTERLLSTMFGGAGVEHAQGHAFQRDAANQYAFPNTFGLVKGDGTSKLLEFLLHAHTSPITPNWSDGAWTLSSAANESGFSIVELDATAAAAIYEDTTGGQVISTNATLNLNVFRTAVGTPDAPFSRVSDTALDVTAAVEVFGYAGLMSQRTAISATRISNAVRFVVEGVTQDDSEYGDYTRGDNYPDTWNVAFGATLIKSLSLNDTLNVHKFDPGTSDGGNDSSVTAGSFFLDLGTLVTSSTSASGTVAASAATGVTASGQKDTSGSAATSAATSATAAGTKHASGGASVAATTGVAASGQKDTSGSVAAAAATSATAAGTKHASGTVAVSAATSVAITGRKDTSGTTAAAAATSVTASGQKDTSGSAATSAATSATAAGTKHASGTVAVSAATSVSITGTQSEAKSGTVAVSAATDVSITGRKDTSGQTSAAAASNVSASGAKQASGSSSITASSAATASGNKGADAPVSMSAGSDVAASGRKASSAPVSMAAASGVSIAAVTHRSSNVAMSAVSVVVATGRKDAEGNVSMSSVSSVSTAGSSSPLVVVTVDGTLDVSTVDGGLTAASTAGSLSVAREV